MSGECEKCGEHALDHQESFMTGIGESIKPDSSNFINLDGSFIEAIIRIGRAQEKLKDLLNELSDLNLSKHNPHWHSEYEIEGDKLDEARRKLMVIHERLWELMGILQPEGE